MTAPDPAATRRHPLHHDVETLGHTDCLQVLLPLSPDLAVSLRPRLTRRQLLENRGAE